MKTILYLMVLCLSLQQANAQTASYNFDFENWYTDSLGAERLLHWDHIDWKDDILYQLHGTKKSASSHSGSSAVTVHRWYLIAKDALRLKQAILGQPKSLNGFYTYTDAILSVHPDSPAVPDIATVTLYVTKWNAILNRPDTIGYGYRELAAATGFTPFSCAITYTSAEVPDSFCLYIHPTKSLPRQGCKINPDCSFLTIDDLSFSDAASLNEPDATMHKVTVYPNPARQELFIRTYPGIVVQQLYLTDITGRIVRTAAGHSQKINVDQLSPGHYLLRLHTNEGSLVKKVIID